MNRRFLVVPLALVAGTSQAAVDVTAAVTEITGLSAPIASIGGAFITLAVVAVGYKWVKAMVFGG